MVDDIHHAAELIFSPDRNAHRVRLGAELVAEVADGFVKVGTGAIHLVDERDPRDVVLGGLPPDGLGLGLHTGHTAEDGHGPVKHTHGTLHLCGEVHVSGGVDDVDAIVDVRK